MKCKITVLLLLLHLNIAFIFAQNTAQKKRPDKEKFREKSDVASVNPISKSSIISPVGYVNLTSTVNDTLITANMSFHFFGALANFKIEAPLSKTSEEIRPAALDELSKNTNINFGVQKIFWNPGPKDDSIRAYKEELKAYIDNEVVTPDFDIDKMKELIEYFEKRRLKKDLKIDELIKMMADLDKLKEKLKNWIDEYDITADLLELKFFLDYKEELKAYIDNQVMPDFDNKKMNELKEYVEKRQLNEVKIDELNKKMGDLDKLEKEGEEKFEKEVDNYKTEIKSRIDKDVTITYQNLNKENREKFDKEIFSWGTPFILGANYRIGRKDFNYVTDISTFDVNEAKKFNWGINLSAGLVFKKLTVLIFSYELQKVYKGGDEFEFVIPYDSSGASIIRKLSIGEPSLETERLVKMELKRIYSKGLGINPSINYSISQKKIAIDFPVYFLKLKKDEKYKGLNGGVFVGWTSKTSELKLNEDTLSAGIFFGAVFDKVTNLLK